MEIIMSYLAKITGSIIAIIFTFIVLPTKRPIDFAIRVTIALSVVLLNGEQVLVSLISHTVNSESPMQYLITDEMRPLVQAFTVFFCWLFIGVLRFIVSRNMVLDDAERLIKAWRGK
jgi:hypothetical protein